MSGAKYPNPPSTLESKGKRQVIVIDATGLVLGRMATHAAKCAIEGNEVHIVNAEKAIIVGSSKRAIQEHYLFKRQVGTIRKGPFFPREPHLLVKRTCRGMINYTSSSGRAAYKRIKAHLGVPKELASHKADTLAHAQREAKTFLTVAELSTWLGRPTPESAGTHQSATARAGVPKTPRKEA